MSEPKDTITTCKRCKGSFCYKQTFADKTETWLCMSCGFTTVSTMKAGSDQLKQLYTTMPDLYRELLFEDDEQLVWFPATITVPEVGMVFIDGTNAQDWKWTYAPIVPIAEDQRSKYPKDQTHKVDLLNANTYEQTHFMLALAALQLQ